MEKLLNQLSEDIEKAEYRELSAIASKIATTAISAFNGKLLRKALEISAAIVDFEDEMKQTQTKK